MAKTSARFDRIRAQQAADPALRARIRRKLAYLNQHGLYGSACRFAALLCAPGTYVRMAD